MYAVIMFLIFKSKIVTKIIFLVRLDQAEKIMNLFKLIEFIHI